MRKTNTSSTLARRRRRAQEAMTLIEIMVVVIIMVMIATAVAVAVIPRMKEAKVSQAKTDAATILTAVEMYMTSGGEGCPTVEDLLAAKQLKKGKTVDPWNHDYAITCEGDEVAITSAGADGQMGTEDDVSNH